LSTMLEDEIASEKATLVQADLDIAAGQHRVHRQQHLLTDLRLKRRNTSHAERLLDLLGDTLLEWKRQRALAEERVAYLEGATSRKQPITGTATYEVG
jgi:hypothetical protein